MVHTEPLGMTEQRAESRPAVQSRSKGHIPALDGFRGIGILLVLVYHYSLSASAFDLDNWVTAIGTAGWSGVDMFFVLSGFLITGILYDAKGKEHYFRNFYARRTLRIFPLYYFATLLVFAVDLIWRHDMLGGMNPLWFIFYVANFQLAIEGGGSFIDHFWSLAIEEQFYLFWPFVVLALSRAQLMAVAALLIVLSPLIRVLLVAQGVPELAVYTVTPARLDSLAMGALIAMLARGPEGVRPYFRLAVALGCAATLAFMILIIQRHETDWKDPVMVTAGISLVIMIFGSGLILTLCLRPLQALLELPILRWFGRYSYGIYVWHPIINVLILHSPITASFGEMTQAKGALLLVTAFVCSLLVSVLSYKWLESPLLQLKHRFH